MALTQQSNPTAVFSATPSALIFFTWPPELRLRIYDCVAKNVSDKAAFSLIRARRSTHSSESSAANARNQPQSFALLLINKQIFLEAVPVVLENVAAELNEYGKVHPTLHNMFNAKKTNGKRLALKEGRESAEAPMYWTAEKANNHIKREHRALMKFFGGSIIKLQRLPLNNQRALSMILGFRYLNAGFIFDTTVDIASRLQGIKHITLRDGTFDDLQSLSTPDFVNYPGRP